MSSVIPIRPSQFHRYPPRRGPDFCVLCGASRQDLTPDLPSTYSDLCDPCWKGSTNRASHAIPASLPDQSPDPK